MDGFFFCHISLQGEELVGVVGIEGGEFLACLTNVDGGDAGGAVVEAAVCYLEADALGGRGFVGFEQRKMVSECTYLCLRQ